MIESLTSDPIALKDFALGFFIALSLRRSRILQLIDQFLPVTKNEE